MVGRISDTSGWSYSPPQLVRGDSARQTRYRRRSSPSYVEESASSLALGLSLSGSRSGSRNLQPHVTRETPPRQRLEITSINNGRALGGIVPRSASRASIQSRGSEDSSSEVDERINLEAVRCGLRNSEASSQGRGLHPNWQEIPTLGPDLGVAVDTLASRSDRDEEPVARSRVSERERVGSLRTRIFAFPIAPEGDIDRRRRASFEAHRERQRAREGSVLGLPIPSSDSEASSDLDGYEQYWQSPSQSTLLLSQGTVASQLASRRQGISPPRSPASEPDENVLSPGLLTPPPLYSSNPASPYSDGLLSRITSLVRLNLLGVDAALRDSLRPLSRTRSSTASLTSNSLGSLPPSYHTSPSYQTTALPHPLDSVPERYLTNPTATSGPISMARIPMHTAVEATHDGLDASNHSPLMMMPVPHPTGPDGRRSSAPAVPVRVGLPAVPLQSPTVSLFDMRVHTAPPIPQRPSRPYIAPKPHTMPEMAIRLRAQSFASRAELDRPLPPLPRTRTESIDSQAMSLSDMDNPTDLMILSEDGESSDQTPPKPVTKPFLQYTYHPTHVSSHTRNVLSLPTSLFPDRHPLPATIFLPPHPSAFQIMTPSFEELLQRLFESGTSRIEPTPDVYEVTDDVELVAWLRFFKVVPADSEVQGRPSSLRRLPFRRKTQPVEYRVVLGLQLVDPKALGRIKSSSSTRVPPSLSSPAVAVPPLAATSLSGPNPLLTMPTTDPDGPATTLESTWFVPVHFSKCVPCPCTLAALGEALFRAEQESRLTGSRAEDNGDKKLWQVIQAHRTRSSSFTENGVSSATATPSFSLKTNASSDLRLEEADLVARNRTKGIFRRMTMVVADAGTGVGARRTVTRERERERDLRANFVTPYRAGSPT